MKMKELSATSGVSVATIKFYAREGLLHPGRAVSATQAEYDDTHLDRLRLIRVLREVGEMPLARIESVIGALEDDRTPLVDLLGEAHHALGPDVPTPTPEHAAARDEVVAWVASRGWSSAADAPSIDALAGALLAIRGEWAMPELGPDVFTGYAEAAEEIARHELETIDPASGRSENVRQVIVGTVVFERALVALRRLAQEHFTNVKFAPGEPAETVTSGRARRSPTATGRTRARGR